MSSNYFSSLRTRSIVEPEYIYDKFPSINSLPRNLDIDYTKILHKPYFVKNIKWGTGDTAYNFLDYIEVPFGIIVNELTKYPFNTSVMFRAKVSLIFQVSATPMHQGTVLIGALPSGVYASLNSFTSVPARMNKLMVAPHGFLYANESTAVRIQVPFYNNSKLVNTDVMSDTVHPNRLRSEFADVVVMVVNPLAQPTSAAESVTISVHAVFDELDFYVPHIDTTFVTEGLADIGTKAVNGVFGIAKSAVGGLCDLGKTATGDFLDYLRGVFKQYTGLHNPNYSSIAQKNVITARQNVNQVDIPTYFEKLDPYGDYSRITKDYLFDTATDEMLMSHLLSKPMFVSSFTVKSTTTAGTPLFARPITPFQQTPFLANALDYEGSQTKSPAFCDLHTMFFHLSKYWRGGLSVHIQSNMTNFHFCKLLVARNYSPVEGMASGYPKYEEIQNLMVETLEFSGGGQVQTVDMPYISVMDFLPTTTNLDFNAFMHGMYYIYLAQPLVSNGSVPVDIQFNVYISMNKDFQYYGYSNNLLQVFGFGETPPASREFEAEAATMQPIEDQSSLNNPGEAKHDKYEDEFLRPIVSVRDYSRRMYRTFRARFMYDDLVARNGVFAIDVGTLLKPPMSTGSAGVYQRAYSHPLAVLRRSFLGYNGGLKVKAVISGSSVGMMWYSPPSYVRNADGIGTTWVGTEPLAYASPTTTVAGEKLYGLDNGEPSAANYSSVMPTIERPNYTTSTSGASTHRGTEENVLMGGCILEAHVPNLSPYRFLGDGTSMDITVLDSKESPFEQMGHLIITLPRDPSLLGYNSNAKCSVELALWIGADDEGRFGFQSILPFYGLVTKKDIVVTNDNDPFTGLPGSYSTYNQYLYLN